MIRGRFPRVALARIQSSVAHRHSHVWFYSKIKMVKYLIAFSFRNRWMVLLAALGLFAWGFSSMQKNPIDAIPDLSENQVIVFTEWMGRSPQLIEDQVTYPLVSNLQNTPKIKTVRGTSMFGMSFVYVV